MTENAEFLEKFGYRSYHGERNSKFARILSMIMFEVKSTWHRSTMGKVFFVVVVVTNLFAVLISATISIGGEPPTSEEIRNNVHELAANYLNFLGNPIHSSAATSFFSITIQLGFFLIILFGIAGSGMIADDKEGRVIEIYMSRISKIDYLIAKIFSIVVYTNLFILLPLITISFFNLQSYGVDHLDYIDFYLGLIGFSVLSSLILGLGILVLSSLVDKRQYASLGYFLVYLIAGIFGQVIYSIEPENEFLLLISPEIFLSLLAYVCFRDFNLGIGGFFEREPFLLNDGLGLEYYHVILTALGYLVVFSGILLYKMKKLTTEEL